MFILYLNSSVEEVQSIRPLNKDKLKCHVHVNWLTWVLIQRKKVSSLSRFDLKIALDTYMIFYSDKRAQWFVSFDAPLIKGFFNVKKLMGFFRWTSILKLSLKKLQNLKLKTASSLHTQCIIEFQSHKTRIKNRKQFNWETTQLEWVDLSKLNFGCETQLCNLIKQRVLAKIRLSMIL